MAKRRRATYNAISLFTGAGGMDAGLERTGRFVTVACSEKQAACCRTLQANRDAGRLGRADTVVFEGPIEALDPRQVLKACGLERGELDLLAGGPPCQAYSTVGKRGTLTDPRGMLLWEFLRFVEALQPKYFLMENVRGLLSAAIAHRPIAERPNNGGPPLRPQELPGSVVDLWVSDLLAMAGAEYRVDCFEVNAVNYGAPQLRERALFIGNRLGQVIDFPSPTHFNPYVGSPPRAACEDAAPFRTLGAALDSVAGDDGEVMDFSPRKKMFLAMVPEGGNWRTLPPEVQQESMGRAWHATGGRSGWWRRLSRDLPCPTVVAMPNHASTAMCHPTETRALTLRECAAVQEFPGGWEFAGTTMEKYAQVGNALPTRLATVAGEVLAARLDAGGDPDPHAADAGPYRRIYINSHVRTRQWYKQGTVYTWRDGEDNSHAHYSGAGRLAVV